MANNDQIKADLNRISAINREDRLAMGGRKMMTMGIPSRREKQQDPRRQRKTRPWERQLHEGD